MCSFQMIEEESILDKISQDKARQGKTILRLRQYKKKWNEDENKDEDEDEAEDEDK